MSGLLPARNFKIAAELSIVPQKDKETKVSLYQAIGDAGRTVGYCFKASGPGFADQIDLVVALDARLEKIIGFDVLASNETPGFGDQIMLDYYRDQFKGAPAQILNLVKTGDPKKIDSEIVAITGATVSSDAVVSIFNNYVQQIKTAAADKGLLRE